MIDFYQTPAEIVRQLIGRVERRPALVADLAVGEGDLLLGAFRRWGASVEYIAVDIEREMLDTTALKLPHASLFEVDVLAGVPAQEWERVRRRVPDLILLNPPYSYRGSGRFEIEFDGVVYRPSPALAFTAKALEMLSPSGQILAVLPRNVMYSEHDQPLLDAIRSRADFRWTLEVGKAFPGVHAQVILVELLKKDATSQLDRPSDGADGLALQRVSRGSMPLYRVNLTADGESGYPFIHSTDLKALPSGPSRKCRDGRVEEGHFVLLPRVGLPTAESVKSGFFGGFVLSDCVLAIRCGSMREAVDLRQAVLARLPELRSFYAGSCAPYITKRLLAAWLVREVAVFAIGG